jgi:lysophospholipase L1-like esterase
VQLVVALRAAGMDMGEPRIVAQTGWTADELSAAIDTETISETFDIVSLLIGVNNQFRGRSLSEYREQFCHLLAQAFQFANGVAARVIVFSIPDWAVMPFAEGRNRAKISTEIDQFNAVAQYEAARLGVNWVDVTRISRDLQPGWAADDGLHPSGAQYAAWVASALPIVRKALAR